MSKHKEALYKEKKTLLLYMKNRNYLIGSMYREGKPNIGKNAEQSNLLRKEGNLLYTKRLDNREVHPEIWDKYTMSIIFAPNNSDELALGYGNRSALSHYLNLHEECIKDCNRAIRITTCDNLKIKLLCRKADSLTKLNRSSRKVCEEALLLLAKLKLDEKKKDDYERQLSQLLVQSISMTDDNKMCEGKNYAEELLNFERSQEIPCASKSVAIKYTKKWGRHIVATDDIEPGAIIAFEKHCISYPCWDWKYKYCGNCMKYLFRHSSIPCEYCIYNVYCSQSCRKEAWQKYHQFECSIYPFLNFNDVLQNNLAYALRFIVLAIHEAGGIEPMKTQLLEIENTKDLRIKGFSDGIFPDAKAKNIFSLQYHLEEHLEYNMRCIFMENSYLCVRLLAKHTNFFGKRITLSESEMFLQENLLFTAALFLRFYYISIINMSMIKSNNTEIHGFYTVAFSSLFNHRCDPNVESLTGLYIQGGNTNIYIACHPIKKGSQLFLAYDNNTFLDKKKEDRQKYLQFTCKFICDCIACKENWSSICLPSVKDILQITPSLNISMPKFIKDELLEKFTPEQHNQILHYLKLLSKNCTVYCHEYLVFLKYLIKSYVAAFLQCA